MTERKGQMGHSATTKKCTSRIPKQPLHSEHVLFCYKIYDLLKGSLPSLVHYQGVFDCLVHINRRFGPYLPTPVKAGFIEWLSCR